MPSVTFGYHLTGPSPLAATVTIPYTAATSIARLELTDVQTYEVDLGMMPANGLRVLLVVVDTVDAGNNAVTAPITITWSSDDATKSEKVAPGGFFALGQPTADDSVTLRPREPARVEALIADAFQEAANVVLNSRPLGARDARLEAIAEALFGRGETIRARGAR